MHPEVFRNADHNGTSFNPVWWSVYEKHILDQNITFLCIWRVKFSASSGCQACQYQWYKFQSCMMIHFWRKIRFWAKTSLSFVFRGPNSAHPEDFRCADPNGTSFKALWWPVSEKTHLLPKTSLSFVFRGPNSTHCEVFRHANTNGTSFKAVSWSFSEKRHFGLKHHFLLYLEGQTQCILRFSGMPIPRVQVSKLYDDPFLRKPILG